jgi:hypothetical protein
MNQTAALVEIAECEDRGDCVVAPKGSAYVIDAASPAIGCELLSHAADCFARH